MVARTPPAQRPRISPITPNADAPIMIVPRMPGWARRCAYPVSAQVLCAYALPLRTLSGRFPFSSRFQFYSATLGVPWQLSIHHNLTHIPLLGDASPGTSACSVSSDSCDVGCSGGYWGDGNSCISTFDAVNRPTSVTRGVYLEEGTTCENNAGFCNRNGQCLHVGMDAATRWAVLGGEHMAKWGAFFFFLTTYATTD